MGHRNGTRIDEPNVNQHVVTQKPKRQPRKRVAKKKAAAKVEAPPAPEVAPEADEPKVSTVGTPTLKE